MRLAAMMLAGVGLFASGNPAAAQDSSAPSDSSPSAASQQNDLEIIVTARRQAERAQDVPFTVVPVSGEELSRAGVYSVRNIEAVVSGFTTAGQGFQTNIAIRGVSTF